MKKLLLHTLLLVVASIPCFLTASAQTMPPVQNHAYVYPINPVPTDSMTVAYVYLSGDACPDYYLVKDSIVSNRIYISKKNIVSPVHKVCATVLTDFSADIRLGILPENTQIYFDGVLIKTIQYPCIPDRKGTVVAGTGDCNGQLFVQETTVYLSAIPRLYALSKTTTPDASGKISVALKPGDKVNFRGTEIKIDSTTTNPCHIVGFVDCYEVIPVPPVDCVKDKKGIVVSGEKECAGQLFIQEYSPISSARQLYVIQNINYTNANVAVSNVLKVGDQVLFGGYPLKNDSSATYGCRTVGVATCYEVISIPPVCVMDQKGIVTAYKDNSTLIKDSLTGELYAINNVKLTTGTLVKFKGVKIQCITTPCYNQVECYEVIQAPTCIMDKTGVIYAGIDGCTGRLFIRETPSATTYSRIYEINEMVPVNSSGATGIKPGDKVKFGGYLIQNDSNIISLCHIDGIATCFELLTPPACLMDKKGIVAEFKDSTSIVKETLTGDLYAIYHAKLTIGTQIIFRGIKVECITTPCYNQVECYTVIDTPTCVMDKPGVVVAGTDACVGQLFIEETTPYMSAIRRLYEIKNIDVSGTISPINLKAGDQVKFGGYLTLNDSSLIKPCHTIGVATCYVVVNTPPPACLMDKTGVVVPGIDGCTGRLFIQDATTPDTVTQLYTFDNIATTYNSNQIGLKAGDKVKFGGYLIKNDSTFNILCPIAGKATCYELISQENLFTLSGSVNAGNTLMTSGIAILYRRDEYKATAKQSIITGTFTFNNLAKGDYTVYVIPAITRYRNYLPTFYISNYLYKNADYLTLDGNVSDVTVNLKPFDYPTGTGKITGNIFFEAYTLKDSLMVDNATLKAGNIPVNNSAMNTPVILLNKFNVPVAWTLTDMYGNYTFENIALDTYKIHIETASARGESIVSLYAGNASANADVLLKSALTDVGIPNTDDTGITIYPNPVDVNLIVVLKVSDWIDIYNSMGQFILHKELNQGINIVDVSMLDKGVYVVKTSKSTLKLTKK